MTQSAHLIDVEVVLDDDDRVAGVDERCSTPSKRADVLEVQARRRLVEHVERAARLRLPSSRESFTRCASPPLSVGAGWPIFM